jgi:uncharacterized protein (TIGR00369 family)
MDRETLIRMGEQSPYFSHLDMGFEDSGDGWASLRMNVQSHHMNIHGVIHGGALSSLADQTAMRALQTLLAEGQAASTVQMDVHFLAPAGGKVLWCKGTVRKMGRKTAFVDAEVFNEDGGGVALARCTITISRSRKKVEI